MAVDELVRTAAKRAPPVPRRAPGGGTRRWMLRPHGRSRPGSARWRAVWLRGPGAGGYLTFRVLDFPDLTVDGSLGFGASVTGRADHLRPLEPLADAAGRHGAGALAGLPRALLHTALKMNGLLASILVAISMFTDQPARHERLQHAPCSAWTRSLPARTATRGALGHWLAPFGALAARGDFRASVVLLIL